MRISHVRISNFRLLKDVDLHLEEETTVIVGRNNTGKTSLTELFRRLLSGTSPNFALADFSLGVLVGFWEAFQLQQQGKKDEDIRAALPFIAAIFTVTYDPDSEFGPLHEFIVDLDPDSSKVIIAIRYDLQDGKLGTLFADLPSDEQHKPAFYKAMRDRIPTLFATRVTAIDPNDKNNTAPVDMASLRDLLRCEFITAQRGLDDTTHRDTNVLANVLQALLNEAMRETADPGDKDIVEELREAVESIQNGIDTNFNNQVEKLLPAFKLFGYPGLRDPNLQTETVLDVERLLKQNTKVHYAGTHGISLPEAYNGLGTRNLIFILLKLLEFFKSYRAQVPAPGVHLVFIEEPEAHLHPQMQEVFVRKLTEISQVFSDEFAEAAPWPVQFVLTTHSSHMANVAPFDAMRYFLVTGSTHSDFTSKIKDLKQGLAGNEHRDFLHQYMTLTRCDLLFADKAVLIEGTTERLLLPKMIAKADAGKPIGRQLGSQYVTVMEVGGAYAHRFFSLLDFLELPALIVTDIDTVNADDGNKACRVSEGTGTSNGCIREWFEPNITPEDLLKKNPGEKISGQRRLAYQVPESEDDPCGRSFEDSFILANPVEFDLNVNEGAEVKEEQASKIAHGQKKSTFALKFAIEETDWQTPRYIAEGIEWLTAVGLPEELEDAQPVPADIVVDAPNNNAEGRDD